MPGSTPIVYQRRRPEETALYEVVRRHYETFKARVEAEGRSLPPFVEREFEKYLECGILAHGFVRCRCRECGFDRLVAFSCKGRAWCPSCIARRMADTAAYLVDQVIPEVPMRTWTLTFPQPLRYLLAYKREVLGEVIRIFTSRLLGSLKQRAKTELGLRSIAGLHPGMITWIQRFGSAANLNVHLHSAATEGVFVENASGDVEWHTVSPPSSADVEQISWAVCQRVTQRLQELGCGLADEEGAEDALAEREPLLAACYSASILGFTATGQRAGQRAMQMGVPVADHGDGRVAGPAHGFSLYAGRCIGAFDRKKREHVIRYMARPPIPTKRLSLVGDGDVLLELKRPWSNGTTHLRFAGPDFIERLVSLVPPPKVNLVRYHGVFAPNSHLRRAVVGRARKASGVTEDSTRSKKKDRYLDWAALMRRVFEIDVTRCPRCGTQGIQAIACITDSAVIRDILACIGEPTGPPVCEPASLVDPYDRDFGSAA